MCKCYECVYLGLDDENERFYCNFGDSEHYNETVTANDGCDEGEDN